MVLARSLLPLLCTATGKQVNNYSVRVGSWTGHVLPAEFVSYTVDLSSDRGFFHRNLENAKLRWLARQLAPAFVRFGGTGGDRMYYWTGESCPGPPFHKCWNHSKTEGTTPKSEPRCLNASMWESVVEFSEHADARLVFGTNGNLDLANVAKFLEIAQDNISILEVGNEMYTTNGSTPEKCTDMQASLGASLSARFPDLNLAGPDSGPTAIHADYLDKLLLANGNRSDVLYAATVHHYPLDGHVTTDDPTYFPPSAFVNVESVERWRLELNANGFNSTQLWIGEGGGQSSGGQPGSTDSFASGQWYLDSLGAYARGGVDVFCRQDLVGANYGLLEDGCPYGGLSDVNPVCDPAVQPEPLPDYWNALLWKRIMGPKPLEVGVEFASDNNDDNASYFLRAYAHFSSDNSTIGVLLINTDVDRPANVSIELRSGGNERLSQDYERLRRKTNSEGSYPSRATHDRVDWHLTSENKSSSVSFLNGVKLALRKDDNGWKLPSLDGVPANLNDPIIIAPQSYSFFAFSR